MAGRALRRALKLAPIESPETFNTLHTAHLGMGAIAERTGHPRAALRHYRAAPALAERYHGAMLHPQFLGAQQNLYAHAVVLAAPRGQATAARERMEASRSRTFGDLLALTALPRPATRATATIMAEEARWLDRLRGLLTQPPGAAPAYCARSRTPGPTWNSSGPAWTTRNTPASGREPPRLLCSRARLTRAASAADGRRRIGVARSPRRFAISGDRSVAIAGSVSGSIIITGDHHKVG